VWGVSPQIPPCAYLKSWTHPKAEVGINADEFSDLSLQAEDVAQVIIDICKLSAHVVIEDITIWGIDQIVVPLPRQVLT
jgi:NADP-dependent 3-hydroxy acid dehydrogenase YdfG